MKKKQNKFAVIAFSLSAVFALAAVSLAAYTSLSSVKRVVTVKGTEQLFSSKILIPYTLESELQTRIVSFADNSEKKIVEIDVANHLQGDVTKCDSYGITYSVKFELIDISGNKITDEEIYSAYKIDDAPMSVNPYVVDGSLPGRAPHENTFKIEIPAEYMSVYRIKVTAVPNGSRYSAIGRIIATSTEVFTPHWSGKFMDTEQSAVNNGEMLGILNYQISGHIEEDCVLSWNPSRVDIDPWSLTDLGASSSEVVEKDGRCEITLHLGAKDTPDQYDIKFYRTYSAQDVVETWSEISDTETGYITFKNSATGE